MNLLNTSAALSKHLAAFLHDDARIHWRNTPIVYQPNQRHSIIGATFLPATLSDVDFCQRVESKGLYSLNIYTPIDVGIGQALKVADALIIHFRQVQLGALHCGTPTPDPIGDVGEFYVFNVSVPWRTFF